MYVMFVCYVNMLCMYVMYVCMYEWMNECVYVCMYVSNVLMYFIVM